ncbi:FcoT family thioesterase [Streptomyces sp. NPDC001852]|uniref:FcoT family thioesterase n=1 Tax=Streptomyces sp. NPDC001852 TaxID=3364619 RepID=UPI0036B809BD
MQTKVREAVPVLETDQPLLDEVLTPYLPHCRYLRSASVSLSPESALPLARCEFTIPESCYIADTGHFNSVEFNICYNQMAYYVLAKTVQGRLTAPFDRWDMDDFRQRQLPSILITDFRSRFRRPVNGRRFSGEFSLTGVTERTGADGRRPLILVESACRYWDDAEGRADGTVRLAIVDPPLK